MNFRRDQASWLYGLQLERQMQIADNERLSAQTSHDFLGNSRNFVNKRYEVRPAADRAITIIARRAG
jgi:hypothetical protein